MKYGVRDGVLRQNWMEVFGEAAWIGFDGVELDIDVDYESSLLWNEDGRRRLLSLPEGSGVELSAFCLGALWTYSPADKDEAVRRRAIDLIGQTTRFVRSVDCSVILIPITPGKGSSPDEQKSLWIDGLKQAAPVAEETRVCLAIENVGGGCARTGEAMVEIIDAVGSAWVQAYYDFGNALYLGSDPVDDMLRLGARIRQVHAKDPNGDRLGRGDVKFPEVLQALRQIHYDGYVVLETDPTSDPVAAASDNLHFLQKLFA